MSWDAQAWAAKQFCPRPSDKLILIGLSICHNSDSGIAYPSTAWLVKFSSLDRKTVLKSLQRLQDENFIQDTGERKGNGVKCFQLNFDDGSDDERDLFQRKTPIPKTGQVKKRTHPTFGHDPSQKRDDYPSQKRDTEPVTKPLKNHFISRPPISVDKETWENFLAARPVKMTEGAYNLIIDKVNKANERGIDPNELFNKSIENGYRTIFLPDEGKKSNRGNDSFRNQIIDRASD